MIFTPDKLLILIDNYSQLKMQKISFTDFLANSTVLSEHQEQSDVSLAVKQCAPWQRYQICSDYGEGWVQINPLLGGASLVIMNFNPSQDIEVYQEDLQHSGLAITYCLAGKVQCQADDNKVSIDKEESCFQRFTKRIGYSASRFLSGTEHKYLTLHLSNEWLTEAGRSLGLAIINDSFWSGVYNLGRCDTPLLEVAEEAFNTVHKGKHNHHFLSAKALELWSLQLETLEKIEKCNLKLNTLRTAEDVARIMQAEKILRQNYQSPPNLLALARRIGINDNKLKAGFKEVYQETVFAYLRKLRLEVSKELLVNKRYTVAQTSENIGYNSSSHFSVAFKKAYGITPREFQRQASASRAMIN